MVKTFDDTFGRLDTIAACGGRTDGQTDRRTSCIVRAVHSNNNNHRLRGSASTVLTATSQVNGRWRILTPHRIETHEPTATNFRTNDYVRGRTP